jgi:hypothetical protein
MSSGILHPVALIITDVSENISPPSSGFRNHEDGGDLFSETSALTTATWCNTPEDITVTATKTPQKTVFFDHTQLE